MGSYLLYAETAFIHQGERPHMEALIRSVAESSATAIKFQVLTNVNDFVSTHHKAYHALASYCFSLDEWQEFFQMTIDVGLDIVLMPLNVEALTLSKEFPIKYIEIHPVSYHDQNLKSAVKSTGRDVILSTGGRTQTEIEADLSYYNEQAKVLMVGYQAFPSRLEEVRIHQIATFHQKYPQLLIGYADHSAYDHEHAILSLEYAYLLGARVFEKHVALQVGKERVDYSAAVGVETISTIAERLTFIEKYIHPNKAIISEMTPAEIQYRNRQLVCVAAKEIAAGHLITAADVTLKMYHESVGMFSEVGQVIGKRLLKALAADTPFEQDILTEG